MTPTARMKLLWQLLDEIAALETGCNGDGFLFQERALQIVQKRWVIYDPIAASARRTTHDPRCICPLGKRLDTCPVHCTLAYTLK